MKSELALTRRTTYRAEENVGNLEKVKKKQDLLINSMNEEIKRLNEQKTLYQAQLISQKEETAAARNTLNSAATVISSLTNATKRTDSVPPEIPDNIELEDASNRTNPALTRQGHVPKKNRTE